MANQEAELQAIEESLNNLLLNLYDMSIANAPMSATYCRETVDIVGKNVGECRDAIARIRARRSKTRR